MTGSTEPIVQRFAAFSDGNVGGNLAGVVIVERMLPDDEMQRIAAEVGYSETVFAAPEENGWRVRYFAPACEVAFCGHATIALGAALARSRGDGTYSLTLNHGRISVQGRSEKGGIGATLVSPPTRSHPADPELVADALNLFGFVLSDLDPSLPPAIANAGNDHLILVLRDRTRLSSMAYDLERGATFMSNHGLTTISLLHVETPRLFHSRNAFAIGGVAEDPATGAAAAALAGYLRDLVWPHGGAIDIVQGEDMGARSLLHAEIPNQSGSGILVSGSVRAIST